MSSTFLQDARVFTNSSFIINTYQFFRDIIAFLQSAFSASRITVFFYRILMPDYSNEYSRL